MTEAILYLIFLLVGYFLRDFRIEKIKETTQEIKQKLQPKKIKYMEWENPKEKEDEKINKLQEDILK